MAAEVWILPPDSVTGTRWTRWPPASNFRRDQAPAPSTMKLISLKPPSSVSLELATSTRQPFLGVHGVHAEEIGREEHALLPADAAADLHDDVFAVVGILRQEQDPDLALAAFPLGSCGAELLLVAELRRGIHVLAGGKPGAIGLDEGAQLARFLLAGGKGRGVGVDLRPLHAGAELFVLIFQLFKLFKHENS